MVRSALMFIILSDLKSQQDPDKSYNKYIFLENLTESRTVLEVGTVNKERKKSEPNSYIFYYRWVIGTTSRYALF
jgi:hypothetical protein